MLTYVFLLVGLVLLTIGGDILVRGATSAAKILKVSPLLIGLTLVGFGTSTPELVTGLTAALAGSPGIAIGNVVGSNTANILLILGITALILPLTVDRAAFRRDGAMLVFSALACLAVVLLGVLDRWVGVVFLGCLIGYVVWAYKSEAKAADAEADMHKHIAEDAPAGPTNLWLALGLALLGIAITIGGARLLVDNAIVLAKGFGISDTIIGLTIVAVGTSLPELITSVIAALKKHSDVALGNIIGSNIYNVLGILGITALIKPIPIPQQIAQVDIWVMLGATALLIVFVRTGMKIMRWEGAAFIVAFAAYTAWLVSIA
jgi:cation:H+ antiporter